MSRQVIVRNAVSVTGLSVTGFTDRVGMSQTEPVVVSFGTIPIVSGTLKIYTTTGLTTGDRIFVNGVSVICEMDGWNSYVTTPTSNLEFRILEEYADRNVTVRNTNGMRLPTFTYTQLTPEISNFARSGDSIDEDIIFRWTQADSTAWKLEAIQNDVVIATKTGTTETSVTFTQGQINRSGEFTFRLTLYNSVYGTSTVSELQGTLTKVEPIIIALEPDNVAQNINNQINISWSTQNQQSYMLILDGRVYNGTTGKSILLPANTLTSGTKTMILTITYTSSWGDVRTASKSVTLLAYGNPPNPILDGTAIYNSTLPTFTWTATEQVGYELKLRNSDSQDIISTGEVISTDKQYTSTVALDNNSNYTLLLRVKNQYNLWSAWVSKVITTAFVVPNTPTIELVTTNNASIIVSLNIEYSSEFSRAEIWRKIDNSDWIRIAYNLDNTFSYEDRFVGNETYYYKVRAIGESGGISESEVLSVTLGEVSPISNFHFTNVEDFTDTVELIGNPTVRLVNNRKIVATVFAGCKAPKLDKGVTKYRTISFSFSVKELAYEKLLEVADNSQVLLYRDGRGRKFYCQVTSYPQIVYASGGYLTISFSITEVEFVEGDFYSGRGNQPSLFFDGTWYFDGTVELDGEA